VVTASLRLQMTDRDLVLAACSGDRDAAGVLIARHRPLVVRLCRRLLGSAELAEDAAQQACIQAFLGLDRLRDGASFGPWLAGIGLNVARHWMRDLTRPLSLTAISGGLAADVPSAELGPEDLAVSAQCSGSCHEPQSRRP